MIDFSIKQGNTAPAIRSTLKDRNNIPVDITGAAVRFHMSLESTGAIKVDGAASIIDAAAGVVQYSWTGANTDTAGTYIAEWEVTYSGGTVETFPSNDYNRVLIAEKLA